MAVNVEEAKNESDVTPPDSEEGKLGFDNDTLRAIVEIYKGDGNESYRKRDYYNAVNFYTEGINVKCKDDELNAKLYSNRATANFYQGKYQETIDDAKAAIELQPTYVKAIERGASACEKLGQREEAIKWCDRGLAINKQNKTLLDLKKSINKPQEKSVSNFPGDVRGFPNPMSVGGFPGGAGFPGAGGAGVFPSESVTGSGETPILNDLFSDKELVAAFQDQVAMQAFQDVSQNPANVSKYGNNKNLQTIIRKLEEKFGPAGEGPPPGSNEGFPGGISFGNMFGGM